MTPERMKFGDVVAASVLLAAAVLLLQSHVLYFQHCVTVFQPVL